MKGWLPTARDRWVLLAVLVVLVGAFALATLRSRGSGSPAAMLVPGKPQLLEFGMGICEQCRRMKPVLEQVGTRLGDRAVVRSFDIREEANEKLAERFGVRVIPVVVLLDATGKEVWRHEGFIETEALLAAVQSKTPG